jgi:hypothetical protein
MLLDKEGFIETYVRNSNKKDVLSPEDEEAAGSSSSSNSCPVQLACDLSTWPALARLLHRLLEIVCQTPPDQLTRGENQLTANPRVEDQSTSSQEQLIGWPRAENELAGNVPDVGKQLTDLLKDIVLLVNSESVREDDREDNCLTSNFKKHFIILSKNVELCVKFIFFYHSVFFSAKNMCRKKPHFICNVGKLSAIKSKKTSLLDYKVFQPGLVPAGGLRGRRAQSHPADPPTRHGQPGSQPASQQTFPR